VSALSRITSSSNSFQPSTDCSIAPGALARHPGHPAGAVAQLSLIVAIRRRCRPVGERRPHQHRVADPRRHLQRLLRLVTVIASGTPKAGLSIACLNSWRSSAKSIADGDAPINWTP